MSVKKYFSSPDYIDPIFIPVMDSISVKRKQTFLTGDKVYYINNGAGKFIVPCYYDIRNKKKYIVFSHTHTQAHTGTHTHTYTLLHEQLPKVNK